MALITDPFDFVNGDDAESADIDSRFTTLYNEINGSLSNANISATAAIAESKLDLSHTTLRLQSRLGVGINPAGGNKDITVMRDVFVSTYAINFPVITSFISQIRTAPYGIDYADSLGQLWIGDRTNNELYRCSTADGTILSSFDSASGVRGIAWDKDLSHLWVADGTPDVVRYNTLGTVQSSFDAPGTTPRGMTYLGGFLYLVDDTNARIYRMNTLGTTLATIVVPGTAANAQEGITDDGEFLYMADVTADLIYKINTLGTVITSYFNPNQWENNEGGEWLDLAHDGAHIWWVDNQTNLLNKALPVGFERTPKISAKATFNLDDGLSTNIIFQSKDRISLRNNITFTANAMTGESYDIANSAQHGLAFDKRSNVTSQDYFSMNGGTRILKFRLGTFLSSFSLSGMTDLTDITYGGGYLWAISNDGTTVNNIYRITSDVYDTDSLTRAADASFSVNATAGFSNAALTLAYDDRDPTVHGLWIAESTARMVMKINTNALTTLQASFALAAAIAPVASLVVVGPELWVMEGNDSGATALLVKMGTTGTAINSMELPSLSGSGVCDWQSIDFDGRTIWLQGNNDGAAGADDVIIQLRTHLLIEAKDNE